MGLPSPVSRLMADLEITSPRPLGDKLVMSELGLGRHESSKGMGMKDKSQAHEGESSSNGKL